MSAEFPHITPGLLRDFFDLVGMAKEADTLEDSDARDAFKVRILTSKMEANPELQKLMIAMVRFSNETTEDQRDQLSQRLNQTAWGNALFQLADRDDLTAEEKIQMLEESEKPKVLNSQPNRPWYRRLHFPNTFFNRKKY